MLCIASEFLARSMASTKRCTKILPDRHKLTVRPEVATGNEVITVPKENKYDISNYEWQVLSGYK
jgi:hypothetical protein